MLSRPAVPALVHDACWEYGRRPCRACHINLRQLLISFDLGGPAAVRECTDRQMKRRSFGSNILPASAFVTDPRAPSLTLDHSNYTTDRRSDPPLLRFPDYGPPTPPISASPVEQEQIAHAVDLAEAISAQTTPVLSLPSLGENIEDHLADAQAAPVLTPEPSNAPSPNSSRPSTQQTNKFSYASIASMPPPFVPAEEPSALPSMQAVPQPFVNAPYRIDPPPYPDRDVVDRVKKMKLCNVAYLKGNCHKERCTHGHDRRITSAEKEALYTVARMAPCSRGRLCDATECIYGHHCPAPQPGKNGQLCAYGERCKFPPEMHIN